MTLVLALPLWLASPAAADDQVALRFAWPEGARWRVVDQWELEASDADGDKNVRSGVTRALWTWEPTADGRALIVRQPVIVRATPREDSVARAVGAALIEPWRAVVSWDEGGASTAAPAPAPAEVASTEAPPAAEPTAVAPTGVPTDFTTAADEVAFVRGDPVERFRRVFRAVDGLKLVPGRPVFDVPGLQLADAEVSVRADRLAWCPDVGPGSSCVQLTFTRALGGAPAEGASMPAGAWREQEIWVVEPGTLVPHGARVETFSGFQAADGTVRQAHASHVLSFLPPEPPAAL